MSSLDQEVSDAVVAMPHVAFRLTSLEVTDTIEESHAKAYGLGEEAFASAPGEEFVLARLERATPSYTEGGSPVVTLTTGDAEHDLTADLAPMADEQGLLLVSVPEGSPVQLKVADAERSTNVDLRTGELGDVEWTVGLEGATGSRHAWIAGAGWAPDGQAYLMVDGMSTNQGLGACSPQWSLPAGSVTLTPEGGAPVEPLAIDNLGGSDTIQMEGVMYFQVPVDMTSAVLSVAPELSTLSTCEVTDGPDPGTVELPITLT